MADKMKFQYGDTTHEVELKKVNLLCHTGQHDVVPLDPNVEVIDARQTVMFSEALDEEAWAELTGNERFMSYVKMIAHNWEPGEIHITRQGSGIKHVVGLVYLTLLAVSNGKTPYLQYPETHLHPSWQAGIANFIAKLTNDPTDK